MAGSADMKTSKRVGYSRTRRPLSAEERSVYEWQLNVEGYGEEGQKSLKSASVLISRIGGVGGSAAMALAGAGIGRLVIVHQGNVRSSDLNRQTLMTADWVGRPRVESALKRLKDMNPRLAVEIHNANIGEDNVNELVASSDLVIDAAPLFRERFLLNRAAVEQGKPMVDSAMYELEAQLTGADDDERPRLRATIAAVRAEVRSQQVGEVATEFDSVHSVERALRVGSVHAIIPAARLRPHLVEAVERGMR